MKEYYVQSLPVSEVLSDIARLMHVDLKVDCEVNSLRIPTQLGEGTIGGIGLPSGIGIIIFDCKFINETKFIFDCVGVHPVKFLYVTEGVVAHGLAAVSDNKALEQHQSSIVASSGTDGHVLIFPKGRQINLCSVELDRKKLVKNMNCEIKASTNPLKKLLLDTKAENSFYHNGNYNLKLFDMLREIQIENGEILEHHLFLVSVTAAILKEQIHQYAKDLNFSEDEYRLRRDDVNAVRLAVESIKKSLSNPVNIIVLAKEINSTPTKLQQSFKMVYGTTVNRHTKKMRLTKAAELLLTSNKNVTEIVKEVGLVNRGYFSRLFKESYGRTPKEYQMKFKKKYQERSSA